MVLDKDEQKVFFGIYLQLIRWVNEEFRFYDDLLNRKQTAVDATKGNMVANKLFENPEWIDMYLHKNKRLSRNDRAILLEWRDYFILDAFCLIKNLKRFSIFMNTKDSQDILYGVVGITQPFSEMFPSKDLPMFLKTVLLPFKGKIISNGMFAISDKPIDSDSKEQIYSLYQKAKDNYGVKTTLHSL